MFFSRFQAKGNWCKFSNVRDTYMKNNKLYRNTLQGYTSTRNREDKEEEISTKKIELNKNVSELKC